MAEKAKILIADDSAATIEMIRRNLALLEDAEVTATARTGREVMQILEREHVDVLILDLVLPQKDGMSILEDLQLMGDPRPEVIVVSAMANDEIVARAMRSGAAYFLLKPFQVEQLCRKVEELLQSPSAPAEVAFARSLNPAARSLDEEISTVFLSIGIPAHIKGYQYLREAVKMVMAEPGLINAITKELYPGVGERCRTTASKVERAIRHAIDVAWTRGRVEHINRIFGCTVYTSHDKPTNGEFIALLADKMTLERALERSRDTGTGS